MTKILRFSILAIPLISVICVPAASGQERPNSTSFEELRSAVRMMVREHPEEFYMPRYEETESELKYFLGGFAREGSSVDKWAKEAATIPADTMASIEMIRIGNEGNANAREFWSPVLDRAENHVASQVAVLERTEPGGRPDAAVLLDLQSRALNEITSALETVAKLRGKKLVEMNNPYVEYRTEPRTVTVQVPVEKIVDGQKVVVLVTQNQTTMTVSVNGPKLFAVKIDALPGDAEIFYLNKFDYVTMKALSNGKKRFDDYLAWKNSPWSQASGIVHLRGRYYFRARWPRDGSLYQSGEYAISSDTTIPVRPQSP